MAGKPRNRHGLPKPTCAWPDKPCRSIPGPNWTYCYHHHLKMVNRIATNWLELTNNQNQDTEIALPPLDKPLRDLQPAERDALGLLLTWQLEPEEEPPEDAH